MKCVLLWLQRTSDIAYCFLSVPRSGLRYNEVLLYSVRVVGVGK